MVEVVDTRRGWGIGVYTQEGTLPVLLCEARTKSFGLKTFSFLFTHLLQFGLKNHT
jgi:hypothetical protein